MISSQYFSVGASIFLLGLFCWSASEMQTNTQQNTKQQPIEETLPARYWISFRTWLNFSPTAHVSIDVIKKTIDITTIVVYSVMDIIVLLLDTNIIVGMDISLYSRGKWAQIFTSTFLFLHGQATLYNVGLWLYSQNMLVFHFIHLIMRAFQFIPGNSI